MKLRFANSTVLEVVDIRVNNGVLEIDFKADKTAEEIEKLLENVEAMTKIELLNDSDEVVCYYANFTKFAGVFTKDNTRRGYAIQPEAEIEIRLNEVQTAANTALRTVNELKRSADDLTQQIQDATKAANDAAKAANNAVKLTEDSVTVSRLYAQTLDDDVAVDVKDIYKTWDELVKKNFTAEQAGYKFTHETKLYKTAKANVPFQAQWVPGPGTESLYTLINEKNAGTKTDPIPFEGNMILEKGKFYIEEGIVYECIRDSGIAIHNKLKDLVGNYVKVSK